VKIWADLLQQIGEDDEWMKRVIAVDESWERGFLHGLETTGHNVKW
jgi:type II secretory pathway component PulL